jgi:MFS family permease
MSNPPTRQSFFGWRVAALATIVAVMTSPGQTIGVSVFIDRFISDLSLSRSTVATAYLIGTLAGGLTMPFVGRAVDRHGPRKAMLVVGSLFAVAIAAMSGVVGIVSLTLGFASIRMLGQGSLSLATHVVIARWFDRRRGAVIGVTATFTSIGMALAPYFFNISIDAIGWRRAWLVVAVAVAAIVLPIARFGIIDWPSDVGQMPDGEVPVSGGVPPQASGVTRGQAVHTYRFWVLSGSVASVSMLSTGLNFNQIALLGEAGLTASEAALMFIPQVIGSSVAGLAIGAIADRTSSRRIVPFAMALLVASLMLAAFVRPGPMVILYAVTIGAAGGGIRSVEGTLLPRWFGTRHLGSISGLGTLLNVGASALGPLIFSLGRDLSGSFRGVALATTTIPIIFGILALMPSMTKTFRPDTELPSSH